MLIAQSTQLLVKLDDLINNDKAEIDKLIALRISRTESQFITDLKYKISGYTPSLGKGDSGCAILMVDYAHSV